MEPYRIKTAENWNRAFYSNEFISIFKLSPTHNEDLEKIGSYYGGGKIADIFQPGDKGYVDGERHGLIAAEADLPKGNNYDTSEAAKKACSDLSENGYSDWYLPSMVELDQLYLNRSAIGGFADGLYLCSSKGTAGTAGKLFGHDFVIFSDRWLGRVRAIRSF